MSLRRCYLAVVVFFCLALPAAEAAPPVGYYDSVDTTSTVTLRATLHDIIDDHLKIPYTSSATDTWDVLESADEDPLNAGRVLDVYQNHSFPKYGGGNDEYNREHSWPKSYGFPDDGVRNFPYTDCHHLFICDSGYNSSRGNNPYATCSSGCSENATDFYYGQGGGSGTYPGNSNWRDGAGATGSWETWSGRRGDVARALFYMDVRYEGGFHGVTGYAEPDLILTDDRVLIANSSTGNNEAVAYMGLRSVLLAWHLADPVDDLERARNDAVFAIQGNRNPYIDHPEWVAESIPTPNEATSFGSLKALYRVLPATVTNQAGCHCLPPAVCPHTRQTRPFPPARGSTEPDQ